MLPTRLRIPVTAEFQKIKKEKSIKRHKDLADIQLPAAWLIICASQQGILYAIVYIPEDPANILIASNQQRGFA